MIRQLIRRRQPARQKEEPVLPRKRITSFRKEADKEPFKKGEETVRFASLGGLEEVGRNMMFFEYQDEIIVIDAGLQFPEEATPGIDYIIPNISYLEERKEKIKALIITHGHYDHIGAIPHIMAQIGNPPVFTAAMSKEIILRRQEDYPKAPKINFEVVKAGDFRQLSKNFRAEFFGVTHNIPDGIGVILDTPIGKMVHGGEFKFDYDSEGKPKNLDVWEKIGKQKAHTLFLESTGAEEPGYSISERVVEQEIEKLFKKAGGRIIVGTFASLLDRIAEIIKIAEKMNKKVAVSGLSMKTNIQIARNLDFMKIKKDTIIPLEEIHKHKDDKLVILSSSIVPGNERSVQVLKDDFSRQGALVYHYKMIDIHSSGHAPQEELKAVVRMVKPRYVVPIHGYYFMRWQNAQNAQEAIGLKPEETILVDNGQIVNFTKDSAKITSENIPAFYVMVDGLGVGDVGEIVLRDRRVLAEEGMVVVIATLDRRTGQFLKNPDIISRGFIHLRESKDFVEDLRKYIRLLVARIPRHQQIDTDYLKSLIRDQVGQFLYNKTKRRPMILPVVIVV